MDWLISLLQEMGQTLRLPASFVVIEFVGTFAFALSGIRLASAKHFDIFGAWIVGMATAIGGGTLRDLLLGVQPFWMTNPIYFICCALAVVTVMAFGKFLIRQENTLFIFDTIGLALFNVIGIEKALNLDSPFWIAITMGGVTGAAGGIIRDVLINEVPLIFRQEIYALACVAGGIVYAESIRMGLSLEVAALLSSLMVIITRILAVKYHWHLPILKGSNTTAIVLFLLLPFSLQAQQHRIFDPDVHTLTVTVDDDPTLPPLVAKGRHQHLRFEWDEMSHEYIRYIYHIRHCDANWEPSSEIFQSDFLGGLNDQLIEDYTTSFNTTQQYTHYELTLPNKQTSFLLSGNYSVQIFHEGDDVESDKPVLEAQFCVYENTAGIRMEVSSNTDIDFNQTHQQVTLGVSYGNLPVIDPTREIKTFVTQNRRYDNRVEGIQPNIRNTKGIEFTHNPQLIFPAGNEYYYLEILDVHRTAQGIDRMEWFEPYYHATTYTLSPPRNYAYYQDQNGIFVVRSADDEDDDIRAEYVVVHFLLQSPRLPGGDVYVCGLWTGEDFNPDCRMEYDELNGKYHAAILLKQGYYSYQLRQEDGSTHRTMGDFYQTENEYAAFVYFRGQSERYDRLVGYTRVHTNQP